MSRNAGTPEQRRQWRIDTLAAGNCQQCGKPRGPEGNATRCKECKDQCNASQRERRNANREASNLSARTRRKELVAERMAAHLCATCAKPKERNRWKVMTCHACSVKTSLANAEKIKPKAPEEPPSATTTPSTTPN